MPTPRAIARFAPAIDAAAAARRISNVCVLRFAVGYIASYQLPSGATYRLEGGTAAGVLARLLGHIQNIPTY